ncbi:outer membrane receptor protein involved in Fe transport [Sphingopyxis sp. OAS728]|uniref:TonB-dependent receptor domain-containing protein n=1 Tax=Sphingopyxis sp. OAS728 TaxID=2663823 RepID=UPI0017890BAB|nr:TonB-dependent receptor [Sphingopyxis sp. OAS728]MBE1527689.1 outer membrane receptor protein involved in Fe transport [Sphingopyxis sp. OAS728]
MQKFEAAASRSRRNYGLAGVSALAIMLAAPAYAQTEEAPAAPADEAVDAAGTGEAIIVTGSRIRRPNLESSVPITSISGDEFFQTGKTSVGDVLNELPALRSTFSQSNSSRFLGTAGLNLLDLRGLGTQRTLVLQNGRRHIAGDILSNAVSPDVNTIPTDLIERVDIVTGGNSAIYGSDAIAGVVNFILKDNYEGVQLRAQGGSSKYGDAGSYYVSALAGTNFADGRGNVAINFEYAHQEDFYAAGRPNLRNQQGFVQVDTDASDAPNGSDGTPDRLFYTDIRSGLYSNGGSFLSYFGGDYYVPYLFQPNGTLIEQTGEVVGLGPVPTYIGGNGDNFRDGTQFGLSPKLDRYSANLIAHFEVSEAFVPFVEAKYVRTKSLGNASGPFFFNGGVTGSPREVFFTDNPYLNEQAKGIIRDYYGVAPDEDTAFTFLKNAVDLSNREESATRETYRIVGGVRGSFNDDWGYEVSANYGEFREKTRILGNVNLQRFLLAIDAVDQGLVQNGVANGNIVCRASIDPAARVALETAADPDYAAAQLASDVAQCRPANFFGSGNISDEARNYLLQDSFARGKITQLVLSASMSGDTSQFLELPGGPIGFAFGAEYRRETAKYDQDEATAAGMTFYNAIPTFDPPSFEVKELFGELRVPILKETPFFEELTLSAAGRIADYKGATGTVYSYNAGIDWAPVRDIRFRANYSRAVRAPNLVDLYTPLGQNFAPPPVDPCALNSIGEGSATREANCRADGVPDDFNFQYQSSLPFLSGGNPDLKEETSDSYTIGGVIQPRFLPGFSLSVDYYKIVVNDVITAPTAQAIIDTCYDASDLDNQFCDLFERAGPGGGPRGEIEGQILENSLDVVPLNYAKLKVRGIDFELGYRRNLGGIGDVSTRLIYTRVLQNDSYLDPTDPGFADQILYELGDPRDAFNWNVDLKTGPFTIGYKMRYIGKMVLNEYEDFFSKQGRDPQNADYADRRFYKAVMYHDVRLDFEAGDKFNLYVGVDNVTNRLPPLGLTGAGGGSGIYNNIGRFFYAGAVAKF